MVRNTQAWRCGLGSGSLLLPLSVFIFYPQTTSESTQSHRNKRFNWVFCLFFFFFPQLPDHKSLAVTTWNVHSIWNKKFNYIFIQVFKYLKFIYVLYYKLKTPIGSTLFFLYSLKKTLTFEEGLWKHKILKKIVS